MTSRMSILNVSVGADGGSDMTSLETTTGTTTTTTYASTEKVSDGYKWFNQHAVFFYDFTTWFQLLSSLLSFVLNVYFLVALAVIKDLRKISHLPIALQSLTDLTTEGIFGLFLGVLYVVFKFNWDTYEYQYSGSIATSFRDSLSDVRQSLSCVITFFKVILQTYVTGPCILVMAIERFILVVYAASAKEILSRRRQIMFNLILITISLGASVVAALFTFVKRDFERCENSFYHDVNVRNRTENTLYFLLPSIASVAMYLKVGSVLLKTRSQRSRNRNLTLAFLVSCCFWIVLWTPRIIHVEYSSHLPFNSLKLQGHLYYIWVYSAGYLNTSFSFVNPITFIFISRSFQQPIRLLYRKIMKRINLNRPVVVKTTSSSSKATSATSNLASKN